VRMVDAGTAEVGLVTADPQAWGAGIGRRLMHAAEDLGRSRGATTLQLTLLVPRDSVHPAKERLRQWYARLGYRITGSTPFEECMPEVAAHLSAPGDLLMFRKRAGSPNP